jgi:hypothetical protein
MEAVDGAVVSVTLSASATFDVLLHSSLSLK